MKLLLALQYWQGDKRRAEELSSLLSALTRRHPEDVEVGFLLIYRHDAEPPSEASVAVLREAFGHVHVERAAQGLRGYPGGCNTLWRAAVLTAARLGYEYALTFEADCVPLTDDWLERLVAGVRREQARHPKAVAFGALQGPWPQKNVWENHVNGNLVVRLLPELVRAVSQYVPGARAWDLELYPTFCDLGGAVDLREIRSDWRSSGHSEAARAKWVRSGVVFHHGTRDQSLQWQVRRRFGVIPPPSDAVRNTYADAVPSLPDQLATIGGRVEEESIAHPGVGRVFNHSSRGIWKAARVVIDPDGTCGVVVMAEGCSGPLLLRGPQGASVEDPRIVLTGVAHKAVVLVAKYLPLGGVAQTVYRVSRDLQSGQVRQDGDGVDLPRRHPLEKNWMPIGDAGTSGEFPAVYSLYPDWRTIAEVRPKDGKLEGFRSVPPAPPAKAALAEWAEKFGQPRGGTNAVPLAGGRYHVALFHSHTDDVEFVRRYYTGAALLSDQRNGFRCLAVTRRPLLVGSGRDGFYARLDDIEQPAACFFATSLEVSEPGWFSVAGGVNDSWSARIWLPFRAVSEIFSGMPKRVRDTLERG